MSNEAAREIGKRIERELVNIVGEGTFNNFTPAVRAAVTRATIAMGVTVIVGAPEEEAQKQSLAEAKSVLLDVKVAGMAAAGTLWDSLGKALMNVLSPLIKMGAGLFGIKL